MSKAANRFLVAYSGLLTLALGAIVLTGATRSGKASFDEIDVQRINVREADGTLRMLVSSMGRFPDTVEMDGRTLPHKRENAGILFYNDEGVENGGLVFAGRRGEDGKVTGFVHLSMDQYKQDQVLALNQIEDGDQRVAGLTVWDRPDRSLFEVMDEVKALKASMPEAEFKAEMAARLRRGEVAATRVFLGKSADKASMLELKDASGAVRIQLRVAADGDAAIEFLGDDGEVTARLTPESLAR